MAAEKKKEAKAEKKVDKKLNQRGADAQLGGSYSLGNQVRLLGLLGIF